MERYDRAHQGGEMNRLPCDDECRRANHCGGVKECRKCGADICPLASEDGYCWTCAELMAEGNNEGDEE